LTEAELELHCASAAGLEQNPGSMPSESNHHIAGSLVVAVALSAAAGFIDAFLFLRVTPVFVANMSGNLIHLGIATGELDGAATFAALAALASFALGVMAAAAHLDTRVRRNRPMHSSTILLIETALVVCLPIIISTTGLTYSAAVQPGDYPVIVTGAFAMGLQAVALRRVGQVAVSTTYATGSVVRIAEKVALGARSATPTSPVRRRVSIAVLAAITTAYVGGAATATALGDSPAWLLIPAAATLVASYVTRQHSSLGTQLDEPRP
jgi:uncharacterized membrane protein YoaK (UPF0700 family)